MEVVTSCSLLPGPRQALPWYERHVVKANAWVAIFSFIGNYWHVATG